MCLCTYSAELDCVEMDVLSIKWHKAGSELDTVYKVHRTEPCSVFFLHRASLPSKLSVQWRQWFPAVPLAKHTRGVGSPPSELRVERREKPQQSHSLSRGGGGRPAAWGAAPASLLGANREDGGSGGFTGWGRPWREAGALEGSALRREGVRRGWPVSWG